MYSNWRVMELKDELRKRDASLRGKKADLVESSAMEDEQKYSKKCLLRCPYRHLQKLAKPLGLPGNVKKVYLVELIRAKMFSSEDEVQRIMAQIKREREQLAEVRRNYNKDNCENKEFYTKPESPPITSTPKRPNILHKTKPHLAQRTYPSPKMQNENDRLLRNFNLRTRNRNAGVFNENNTFIREIKSQGRSSVKTVIEIVTNDRINMTKSNEMVNFLDNKHKPAILGSNDHRTHGKRQLQTMVSSSTAKRERTLSGIYPLAPKEPTKYDLQSGTDGSMSKIRAFIKKRSTSTASLEILIRKPEVNTQDMSSRIVAKPKLRPAANSSLMQCAIPNINNNYMYNRNIITTEQLVGARLPNINQAFTQFKDFTQPLFVDIDDLGTGDMHSVNAPRNNGNVGLLELYCNFKNQYVVNQPLLQIATTTNTNCVFSTSTVATAKVQPSSAFVIVEPCPPPAESSDQANTLYAQELDNPDSCASIPEMVEDALEVISQDGDYMERLGMDVRIKCMLCSWAGPLVMLEFHIKKDHPNQINRLMDSEFTVTFNLGSLLESLQPLNKIVEFDSELYLISAKYEEPDRFMASIAILTPDPCEEITGTITTFNKVSGEHYSWIGTIQPLQTSGSQEFQMSNDCLRVELSELNLLPYSAFTNLLNREFVNNPPYKALVGHPELDIDIILYIKVSLSQEYIS